MMTDQETAYGATMRILHPAPGVVAFYDGRIPGRRLYSEGPNWLDDGAYSLGVATFALVDGEDALVYDTHISLPHARLVRRYLEQQGVRRMRVVLSHWHADHIAGNAVFADCEIIAHRLTAQAKLDHRVEIETGVPPIHPIVMPTTLYEESMELAVGALAVELRHADAHSLDGTVIFLPGTRLMLAGDTLEDTVTYLAEPDRIDYHLDGWQKMATWSAAAILPNHGAPEIIARGGYAPSLIAATQRYADKLRRVRTDPALAAQSLTEFVAEDLANGSVIYFEPYEVVHRRNVSLLVD